MKSELLERLQAARAVRHSAALLTDLDKGRQSLVVSAPSGLRVEGDIALEGETLEAAREALRSGSSRVLQLGEGRTLLQVFEPPLRLVIVGAVHIAQVLVSMARQTGYAVKLIDPRSAWATPERFPETDIDRRWPREALADLGLDRRTAFVTLTHDAKLDDPALQAALYSQVFYIGALGSRRTQAKRLERMRALGVDESQLPRIHGPIGLDIGALSPAEIAVSILAEITQVLSESRGADA